ncbi:MAG TPA: multiheme c-type cytochrome [Thermodesulfovibrionales bacterium]|nr:multiheme c-type cytochrome [Thermodesulfovibrionales bacterium]
MISLARKMSFVCLFALFLYSGGSIASEKEGNKEASGKLSPQSERCIGCHKLYTPGIVSDWLTSRHSRTIPGEALKKPALERRISAEVVDESHSKYVVGCYECHSLNQFDHKDNFDHMGFRINVVVSPNDCKKCHPAEVKQFMGSKKYHAIKNLVDNPVYHALVKTTTGVKRIEKGKIVADDPSAETLQETCLSCHGTNVTVKGLKKVKTKIGDITVPDLANWPNQGVGRLNPDGSFGACTSCHPRHGFLIEVARKPYTCGQCHEEPDVPAFNVYKESKHGNIFSAVGKTWDFKNVPWRVGEDFKAPTCAACHNSLLVSSDGSVISERSHDFGSRLWVRLFGLIYSHPQPRSGDTTIIKNKDGLPLPVTFSGELAADYLIDKAEQEGRFKIMKGVCNSCHGVDWINGHFAKLENTIKETDKMTLAATALVSEAWEKGLEDKSNPFDETIEKMWIKQWLFYSNSIRYASAMTGAPDYAAFKNGWWYLSENLQNMKDWIDLKKKAKGTEPK